MSQVYVTTQELYRESGRRMRTFAPMSEPFFITYSQLVGVLNSAAEKGPDRYYVLISTDDYCVVCDLFGGRHMFPHG